MKSLTQWSRVFLAASLISAVGAGCGGDDDGDTPSGTIDGGGLDGSTPDGGVSGDAAAADIQSKASGARTDVNLMLSEHLVLAAKATGAALDGRASEFKAYGGLLNTNGTELGAMLGGAYGDAFKTQFNAIWSAHNGLFVAYTTAVATNNQTDAAKAVADLGTQYITPFVDLLATNTGLPKSALTPLVTDHVTQTKEIVDAQKAKDWPLAYTRIRAAFKHMSMLGDPLADATAKKVPNLLTGNALSKPADFRTKLNQALQEHLYLASFATGAALGGRTAEFTEAGKALNANGLEIGVVITSLFGAEAGASFNQIWSAHNGFFVDYTTGVATKDEVKKAKAVSDLTTIYVPQFTTLLVGATGLPAPTVTQLVTDHVLKTKAVVDAQAVTPATDATWTTAAAADQEAGHHMQMLADPLATAIVTRNPTKF